MHVDRRLYKSVIAGFKIFMEKSFANQQVPEQPFRMTTTNIRQISELSREELYNSVWSTPVIKLASEFGISNVAVAKRCIKLGVPRPSAGYWASLAAGYKPKKKPLPPTAAEIFAKDAQKPLQKSLPLPDDTIPLHPLAAELLRMIKKADLDSNKRARFYNEPTMPKVVVSKTLAERVAKAFHVIVIALEPLGILFKKSQASYDGGYFKKGHDRLYVKIEEDLVDFAGTRHQVPTWESPLHRASASGYLTFSLKTDRYRGQDVGPWSESAKLSLEKVLSQIVTAIRQHYLDLQIRHAEEAIESAKRHAEWERRQGEWEAKEVIRLQKEAERKHADALAAIAKARTGNLLKAAEFWRASCNLTDFLGECERQWKQTSSELNAEQAAWLTWAKAQADAMSPFSVGYPNPVDDGEFDPETVPLGGPYPAAAIFRERSASSSVRPDI